MIQESKQAWVLAGYDMFSQAGPEGLKVEVLARRVGKSKSSFYHHFADLEVFTELLLAHHLNRVVVIVEQEKRCKSVVPELVHVLLEVKQDLLFNRQLRINRDMPGFRPCFEQTNRYAAEAVLDIWAEMLGLHDNSGLAQLVLGLTLENFYLQITEKTLTYEWLVGYLKELQTMVKKIQQTGVQQAALYGSV